MDGPAMEPLRGYRRPAAGELVGRARAFRERMATRRTVRDFAPDPVPRAVIEEAVLAAGSAPSGGTSSPGTSR
jgi:hypothetical protein